VKRCDAHQRRGFPTAGTDQQPRQEKIASRDGVDQGTDLLVGERRCQAGFTEERDGNAWPRPVGPVGPLPGIGFAEVPGEQSRIRDERAQGVEQPGAPQVILRRVRDVEDRPLDRRRVCDRLLARILLRLVRP
jgi:hypothetical protein